MKFLFLALNFFLGFHCSKMPAKHGEMMMVQGQSLMSNTVKWCFILWFAKMPHKND